MADYTVKVRRFQPETGDGPYWESFDVELEESLSVLDALLHARSDQDGTLAVRCSCRAAICGSCGVKVNGQSTLACKTKIQDAQNQADRAAGRLGEHPAADRDGGGREEQPARAGVMPIVVEPMANMPVLKDLVTDMESTHWAKIHRVTPWLLPAGPPPARASIVPPGGVRAVP